mmetsp:Transcript_11682/g.11724  ORF Transcript_11682/g.11724 Transcript_11682/m.11724 type:complete len:101 (-) Transcript_11682:171-473(-)
MHHEAEIIRVHDQQSVTHADNNSSLSQLNQYQSKFNSDPNFPTVQHDGPISQPISSRKQQDQLVDNMMRYVPLGADECRFYLECVQWDLEAALKTYYDTK